MTAQALQAIAPKLDAEQSLLRLLELIRGSRRVEDITAERLRAVFGVEFAAEDGGLGFGEHLTRDWWSAFELTPDAIDGPSFEFSFRPDRPGQQASFGEICKVDYRRFADELKAMGFDHETRYGEHGRIAHERFERDDLTVAVYVRGEADEPVEKITHACVRMVVLN